MNGRNLISTTSISSSDSHIMNVLASCNLISDSMRRKLDRLVLHRSRWHCLVNTYSAEIQDLIDLIKKLITLYEFCDDRPLLALQQVLQEGEACMQAYIPVRSSEGNYNSWLVDKALKQAMSTDVVDVHLHHFLWASSIVREQACDSSLHKARHMICPRAPFNLGKEAHLLEQASKLHDIWLIVDADGDLRDAKSFLIKLKGECSDEGVTCQLVDFILQKLSHVQETPHNHVTPDPLPSYMCIHSDQCLNRNPLRSSNNGATEVSEVVWLGGRFVLKSFEQDEFDDLFDEESEIDRSFNREAAIQARVWHPHVVPLVGCTNKPPGLVMELMQEDLAALIKRSRKSSGKDSVPFPQLLMAVDLMLQIAKGMEYLHSDTLCIIHRDLKPANIFVNSAAGGDSKCNYACNTVSPQVELKIADFGISKAKQGCSEYTTRDQGTTLYMAPEVYGDGRDGPKYSNKADVYSFGMVCYAILTGRRPFYGTDIRRRVKEGERPSLPPDCPMALSSFIQMCWHPDPTQRPTFIQICRLLRYFKACIFLKEVCRDEARTRWLFRPLLSLDICAHIDAMIEHCLAGRILEPKALGIPLEIYFCGVHLRKFGFDWEATDWDSWRDEVFTSMPRKNSTREQRMCESGGRWLRWPHKQAQLPDLVPHFKGLRRFTFKELQDATHNFSTLISSPFAVYAGEVGGQEVAVASVKSSNATKLGPMMKPTFLMGWGAEQGALFLVFPCHATKVPNTLLAGSRIVWLGRPL